MRRRTVVVDVLAMVRPHRERNQEVLKYGQPLLPVDDVDCRTPMSPSLGLQNGRAEKMERRFLVTSAHIRLIAYRSNKYSHWLARFYT